MRLAAHRGRYKKVNDQKTRRDIKTMKITEIKIRKTFDEDKLKAVLSITLDDFIVVHDIKIIDNGKRLFAAMPSRKDETGIFRDIVHPINSEIRDKIEAEIIDAYERYIIAAEVN